MLFLDSTRARNEDFEDPPVKAQIACVFNNDDRSFFFFARTSSRSTLTLIHLALANDRIRLHLARIILRAIRESFYFQELHITTLHSMRDTMLAILQINNGSTMRSRN